MGHKVGLVVVTHDSEEVIHRCLAAIEQQTAAPIQVVIVDSGSASPAYLDRYRGRSGHQVHLLENVGFAVANNVGISRLDPACDRILLINPDTFLEPDAIEAALRVLQRWPRAAIATGRLRGYDPGAGRPSGRLDSTGVFRTWYGRWYDRGQGQEDGENFMAEEEVPAICGALMCCRSEALRAAGAAPFDENFFMYKEDIDLCLRLRKLGWKLIYSPEVKAFHVRGWARKRREISRGTRMLAAKNEIRLTLKHRSPCLLWALAKYLLVRVLDV